jgi:glycosyltransferase involved in cell wall biosynthesis
MRIVQFTPGTGRFFCGSCLRDNALVTAQRRQGHDATLVPLYLPHLADETSAAAGSPLFFGGINVYLQQQSALFRHTPAWLDRWLDAPRLLRFAATRASMTSAADLGEMTLSMLRGEEGHQAKELTKVLDWLRQPAHRPDVLSLSNGLLIGMARRIRAELGIPVVATLQGEDGYLDGLPPPFDRQAWELMRQRASDVTRFVAVSDYYGRRMAARLDLSADRVAVVPNGINLDGFEPAATPPPPAIGFLARLSPAKGLDQLVDAFVLLRSQGRCPDVRLRIAGAQTEADLPFMREQQAKIAAAGLAGDVDWLPNLDRAAKQDFLRSLHVLSVPAPAEAFGLYVLEAMACGVPVVQPADGAFPELLAATNGGVLYEPRRAGALADALAALLADPRRRAELGRNGWQAVRDRFTADHMARAFAAVCAAAIREQADRARMP